MQPPRIVTVGDLPELLYQPDTPLADGLASLLARVDSLRKADAALLRAVVAQRPDDDDWPAWTALAGELAALHETLAASNVSVAQAAERLSQLPDFVAHERWVAMANLQAAYEATLQRIGLIDRSLARAAAQPRCDQRLVLLGVLEMSTSLRGLLAPLAAETVALIHAPPEQAAAFDEWGCPVPRRWIDRELSLPIQKLRIVERSSDLGVEVLRCIGQEARYRADQITVALGDQTLCDAVERTLERAGVPARSVQGVDLGRSAPALALASLARFVDSRRIDDLAALIRAPDVESFLTQHGLEQSAQGWVHLLDRYANDHLQGRLAGHWLGDERRHRPLKAAHDALLALLDSQGTGRRTLDRWAGPLAQALAGLYDHRSLNRWSQADHALIASLELLGQALGRLGSLHEVRQVVPEVSAAQAMTMMLAAAQGLAVAPPAKPGSVEVLGYLELQLDDAPLAIVAGMNEKLIPRSIVGDAFLPNAARKHLGLPDDESRYVRDLALFTAILHSHERVELILSRRDAEGGPMLPSRLLLARPDAELPQLALRVFGEEAASSPAVVLLEPGKANRFLIPLPAELPPVLTELRVTAFGDYLRCPYRFYLKHVRGLRTVGDPPRELSALDFGVQAHEALRVLGREDLLDCVDPGRIAQALRAALAESLDRSYGEELTPAMRVQIDQLQRRLDRLAVWHASSVEQGWRIRHLEREVRAQIEVDGAPFTLVGRPDRVDVHPQAGVRVLDYKTGDSGKKPSDMHLHLRRWVDLQLPLYRDLCVAMGLGETVELGYGVLGKKLDEIGFVAAGWDAAALASAREARDDVIRGLRAQRFWPPGDPPSFDDGLQGLCADEAPDRGQIIDASARGGGA